MLRIRNSISFKITGIYRCHNINVENFNNQMKEYLTLNKNIKYHYIVGDFNINLLKTSNQLLTRPNSFEGSCIDNMFIKSKIAM